MGWESASTASVRSCRWSCGIAYARSWGKRGAGGRVKKFFLVIFRRATQDEDLPTTTAGSADSALQEAWLKRKHVNTAP